MKIEQYIFGRMKINGESYTSDLIIYPDRINPSWWRKKGHLVQMEDLDEILNQKPDILIIGTGYMGLMKVEQKVKEELTNLTIKFYIKKSKDAVEIFNNIQIDKKVIGAFHLTC